MFPLNQTSNWLLALPSKSVVLLLTVTARQMIHGVTHGALYILAGSRCVSYKIATVKVTADPFKQGAGFAAALAHKGYPKWLSGTWQ